MGVRKKIADVLQRGSIDMFLTWEPNAADSAKAVNIELAKEYFNQIQALGSEIGAGVRNLSVSQCWFRGTDRGLRIKSRRGRGENCRIDGVSFENIRMEGVLTPIAINLWYNCCDPDRHSEYVWSRECLPVDERTPRMGAFASTGCCAPTPRWLPAISTACPKHP